MIFDPRLCGDKELRDVNDLEKSNSGRQNSPEAGVPVTFLRTSNEASVTKAKLQE